MSFMRNLAIIPARGGSKRIPRKNIRDFLGKPIIAYSIEAALQSNLFEEVMVSTDDAEIAEIAKNYGANVPFFRSDENSNDYATTSDVLKEVLIKYKYNFDNVCCIYPTAPFITVENLVLAYNKLINNNLDSVYPIVEYTYPIQRSLEIINEKLRMVWPENLISRSQDLTKRYHDAGQFYFFNAERFNRSNSLLTDNTGYVEMSNLMAQDIDNETDWKLAEYKYEFLQSLK
jgi:pseudaminic acid cytidylyltransferase